MMICCENQNIYNHLKGQNAHESIKEIKLSEGKIELFDSHLMDLASK